MRSSGTVLAHRPRGPEYFARDYRSAQIFPRREHSVHWSLRTPHRPDRLRRRRSLLSCLLARFLFRVSLDRFLSQALPHSLMHAFSERTYSCLKFAFLGTNVRDRHGGAFVGGIDGWRGFPRLCTARIRGRFAAEALHHLLGGLADVGLARRAFRSLLRFFVEFHAEQRFQQFLLDGFRFTNRSGRWRWGRGCAFSRRSRARLLWAAVDLLPCLV